MAQHSWSQRSVPTPLVARYEQEGWWTDDTLGAKVACQIAQQVAFQAEGSAATTHRGKLFSYLVGKERGRSARRHAA